MQRRNSYSDLGLVIAISIFICILIKCLLFGFTWVGIGWLLFSCVYFIVSWRWPSDSKWVKNLTTFYLLFSVVAALGTIFFDKKTRPVMHAFEGTGDTIQDERIVEESQNKKTAEAIPGETTQQDSLKSNLIIPDSALLHVNVLQDDKLEDVTPDTNIHI